MKYSKRNVDGYLVLLCESNTVIAGEEISVEEYERIKQVLSTKPTPRDGYGYRLREDLTWEEYEIPVLSESDNSNEVYNEKIESEIKAFMNEL